MMRFLIWCWKPSIYHNFFVNLLSTKYFICRYAAQELQLFFTNGKWNWRFTQRALTKSIFPIEWPSPHSSNGIFCMIITFLLRSNTSSQILCGNFTNNFQSGTPFFRASHKCSLVTLLFGLKIKAHNFIF